MKTTLILALAMAALTNAFIVTNCDTGDIHNWPSDGHHHDMSAKRVSFQSDAGCTLATYPQAGGKGQVQFWPGQKVCHQPSGGIGSVACHQ